MYALTNAEVYIKCESTSISIAYLCRKLCRARSSEFVLYVRMFFVCFGLLARFLLFVEAGVNNKMKCSFYTILEF